MRILFTRFPYESALGGAEVQTLTLAAGLRSLGNEIRFLGSCPVLLKEFAAQGYTTEELSIGPPPVTPWQAIALRFRKNKVRETLAPALAHHGADVVIMLSLTEKLLMTEALHRQGRKVAWIEHDRVGRWLTRNPWLPRLKKQASFAEIVTVSGLSAEIYTKLGFPPDHLHVIPNGIDLGRFTSHGRASRTVPPLRVGVVGRLSPEKGIDVLLDAVTDRPEIDLTIVGKGPQEGYLRGIILERQLQDRITITPSVPDVGAFYGSCDVIVLPSSDHDPFGLVAAEAMALGVPVIVTDACGIAGYLTQGHDALIVPAGSAEHLKNALHTFLSDEALRIRLGDNGRATAHRHFDAATMVHAYAALIQAR